jgi:hypothetical protein
MANANRDENRVPTLLGVSSVDGITPTKIEANPTTNALFVEVTAGGGGGTQYTDGDATVANPVGTIPVFDNAGTVQAVSDASGLPVKVVSALPAGTNAIGKLSANSGVDIGDVDVTSIANGSINGPSAPTIDSYAHIAINLNAGADQVLVSSAANKQIWVYGFGFTVSVAGTVSFQDEDDTAITGIMDFAGNSGMSVPATGNFAMPQWKLATDKDLEVDIVTAALDGWLSYAIVSV